MPDPPNDFDMNHFNDAQFADFRDEIKKARNQTTKSHSEVDLIAMQIMKNLDLTIPDHFSVTYLNFLKSLSSGNSSFSLPSDDFFQCLGENELNYRFQSIQKWSSLGVVNIR